MTCAYAPSVLADLLPLVRATSRLPVPRSVRHRARPGLAALVARLAVARWRPAPVVDAARAHPVIVPVRRPEVTHVVATTGAARHYVIHLPRAGMEAQPADIRELQHREPVAPELRAVAARMPDHASSGKPVKLLHDLTEGAHPGHRRAVLVLIE